MTLEELKNTLKTTGIPVAYGYFEEEQNAPYILYREAYTNNFSADGIAYCPISHVQVELYTNLKSPEVEDKVEDALSSFFWEKSETYLDSERCYQILYEIEV